jgi:hypothetical protein
MRAILRTGVVAAFGVLMPGAWAASDEVSQLIRDLPPAAAQFVERLAACLHLGSELRYDAKRARDLAVAERALACKRIKADEARTLAEFEGDPRVLQAIAKVKDLPL